MMAQRIPTRSHSGIYSQNSVERALNDYTLQPGDIVSTEKGLLQFRSWFGADGRTAQFAPTAPR